jgi:hypothetical protein
MNNQAPKIRHPLRTPGFKQLIRALSDLRDSHTGFFAFITRDGHPALAWREANGPITDPALPEWSYLICGRDHPEMDDEDRVAWIEGGVWR